MQRPAAPLAFIGTLRRKGIAFAIALAGFAAFLAGPLGAQVEPAGEARQKPVITPIQVPNLSLGVVIFPNGKAINLSVGTGSGAHRSANDIPGRVWLLTDRGPNIECGEARRILGLEPEQACPGNRGGRILPLPGFVPSIYAADIGADNVARLNVFIPLKGKSGKPLSGRPPQGNGRYESAYAIDGRPLPPDPSGIDPEGLVRLSDGTFWIADEFGPSLLHVAADGTVMKRLVPQGLQGDFKDADYEIVPSLPAILRSRAQNRGFEALALSPDEKFLFVMLQGPLANPDVEVARRSRHLRIFKLWRETGEIAGEYFYQSDDIASYTADLDGRERVQARVVVSEMAAIAEDQLLVLERVDRHTRFYAVQLAGENRVPRLLGNPDYAPSLEALEPAPLAMRGVLPVAKILLLDSETAPGLPAKIEGMAVTGPNEIVIINDNDFGVDGVRAQMFRVTLAQPLIR